MMGGVSPETRRASYEYEINFDTQLHLVGKIIFFYFNVCIFRQQSEENRLWSDASRHSANLCGF